MYLTRKEVGGFTLPGVDFRQSLNNKGEHKRFGAIQSLTCDE